MVTKEFSYEEFGEARGTVARKAHEQAYGDES